MTKKLEIEYIPIAEIIPYAKNPRKNDKAADVVARSIKEFGFKNPIILDKNNEIVAGHTRLNPVFCSHIIERWENSTGKQAEKDKD